MASAHQPRIGIIGGGQLAKMLFQSARSLGLPTLLLDREPHGPAAGLADEVLTGDWNNPDSLTPMAGKVDVVTLENEFVPADSLAQLESLGVPVYPGSKTIRTVQDKLLQKQCLRAAGLPTPEFEDTPTLGTALDFGNRVGWPFVLKKRCNGYDGKGNATVRKPEELEAAWRQLNGNQEKLFGEAFFPYTQELAVIITRSINGSESVYPLVHAIQKNHICHLTETPAPVAEEVESAALDLARRAIESVEGVGSFGVEMFLDGQGRLAINELAPRVHNTGHYTIEGCYCSQFENHIRAILGWPLGQTALRTPAAVMVNLLGQGSGSGEPVGISSAMEIPGVNIHIYGKKESRAGRKMGHVTALGASLQEARMRAERAAEKITFGDRPGPSN